MPIYDVRCDKCGEFEIFSKMDEPVLCPKCGKPAIKLVSAVQFEFKCAMDTWSGGKSGIKGARNINERPKMPRKQED